jgi:hypothetical protein
MTDGPDWAETLSAVKKVPGKGRTKNDRLGMDQVQQWQEFQQQRTGADVAVAMGGVDTGDDFDGWEFVTEATEGFRDGVANAGSFIAGVFHALTGGVDNPESYVDPVNELTYLVDTISGHSQAIAQLQATAGGESNSGVSGGDNFQTSYTGSLGPGWDIESEDGIETYVDTTTGQAEWHNSGNHVGWLSARRIDPADAKTLTEFQRITATVGTVTGGKNSSIAVKGRVSDDGLHYVQARVSNSTVYISYTTTGLAGEVVMDSGPTPKGVNLSSGARLDLYCGTNDDENEYEVRINGVRAQSWTDTGDLATTGVNYAARGLPEAPKGWGSAWRPGNDLGVWKRPSSLASVTIADNTPGEIQGHGFRVYRESTTSSGTLSVSTNLSPFYDEIDYMSPGSSWSAAGYVIPKTGMWSFSWRLIRTSSNWTAASLSLAVNGAGRTAGNAHLSTNVLQDTVIYHCKKGDVVWPYVSVAIGTVSMNGSSTGLDTYFAGACLSS